VSIICRIWYLNVMVSSIGVSRRPLRISDSSSMLDLLTVRPKFTRPSCRAAAAAVDQYLLPAPDLSSKPDRRDRQADRRTDTRLFCNASRLLCGPRTNDDFVFKSRRHRRAVNTERHLNCTKRVDPRSEILNTPSVGLS